MTNMNAIKQKRVNATPERLAQLDQAEKMANDLLAAMRAQTTANVTYLKLGRQVDAAFVEAAQAVKDAAAPPKSTSPRTTVNNHSETIDLTGKSKAPPTKKKPTH
jgi:hypothetical protein